MSGSFAVGLKTRRTLEISWLFALVDRVKVNTDGAFGCDYLIRD